MTWEMDAGPPVLTGANEKDLNRRQTALNRDGKDISLVQPIGIDILLGPDDRQRPDPVPQRCRPLKRHLLGRAVHLRGQLSLKVTGLAAQEIRRLVCQTAIRLRVDQAHTGRRTPLDLVQHAGPLPLAVNAILAGPQEKGFLQCVQCPADGVGAGERPKIISPVLF